MQIKVLLATFASSFLSIANGAVIDARAALDIFSPNILSPNASTIWVEGNVETVTWDASHPPVNISNEAMITLHPAGHPGPARPEYLLQIGFDLRSGSVNITVPKPIAPGQYQIILFGDSGNLSPPFEIVTPAN